MRILLTGKNGQVGWELQGTLAPLGQVTAVDAPDLDLSDAGATRALVRDVAPDLVVNAAAYTAVDRAESEPAMARAVNATAPAILAEEARRLGAPIVHYSTDYIFDGAATEPYPEDHEPRPLSVYGRTKLEGEEGVRASGAAHLIIRLAWVYGTRGRNFLTTMLRLGSERAEIRVVDDQIGTPTWCRPVAEATARMIEALRRDPGLSGTYHLPSAGSASWFELACAIFEGRSSPAIVPIPTRDYPTPAVRPAYSVLSGAKTLRAFGIALPPWRTQLAASLERHPG